MISPTTKEQKRALREKLRAEWGVTIMMGRVNKLSLDQMKRILAILSEGK